MFNKYINKLQYLQYETEHSELKEMGERERSAGALMKATGPSHRPTFRKNYLKPAIEAGRVELTQPDATRSPTQRYRLTEKGMRWFQGRKK